MNFWKRVEFLLAVAEINKKTMAFDLGINPSTISNGIGKNAVPNAETACRIAKYLGTTVEYLVTGRNPRSKAMASPNPPNLLAAKYEKLLKTLERMPRKMREFAVESVERLAELCE